MQIPYENVSEAMDAGKNGRVWGVIHFGRNFTEEFEIREKTEMHLKINDFAHSKFIEHPNKEIKENENKNVYDAK